jgi:hypothetical protein
MAKKCLCVCIVWKRKKGGGYVIRTLKNMEECIELLLKDIINSWGYVTSVVDEENMIV